MSSFQNYNNILLDGLVSNYKLKDILDKKLDLFSSILDYYHLDSEDVLFVGFSPWCLSMGLHKFTITEVDDYILQYLEDQSAQFDYVSLSDLVDAKQKYSIVIAVEEYFTFADSDQQQRDMVNTLANLTDKLLVTTLRDYKNQDFKDKEFSHPIAVRGETANKIYLEHYEYDLRDKNASTSKTYVIHGSNCQIYGPYARRNMYFKQLAKFSLDAGANNFYVHKNLMYKSVIKKNYEHIITIKF